MGEFRKQDLPETLAYLDAQGLKPTGKGRWVTTECRLHGGSDSMRWNTASGGWICMSCGEKGGDVLAYHMAVTGSDFIEAARELGAWEDNGSPDVHRSPKPLPAGAALEVLAFESMLVVVAALNVARGVELSEVDRDRLMVAARRVGVIKEAYQ
jgi:hypothetical protein